MQVDAQVSPICGAKGWYFDVDQTNSFLISDSFTDPELLDSLTEDDAQCKSIILETSIKYGQNGEVISDVFYSRNRSGICQTRLFDKCNRQPAVSTNNSALMPRKTNWLTWII